MEREHIHTYYYYYSHTALIVTITNGWYAYILLLLLTYCTNSYNNQWMVMHTIPLVIVTISAVC